VYRPKVFTVTRLSWLTAKSLGLRTLFVLGLGFWVAVLFLARHPPKQSADVPSDVDTYANVILSGN